jgi:hypothetical protein
MYKYAMILVSMANSVLSSNLQFPEVQPEAQPEFPEAQPEFPEFPEVRPEFPEFPEVRPEFPGFPEVRPEFPEFPEVRPRLMMGQAMDPLQGEFFFIFNKLMTL